MLGANATGYLGLDPGFRIPTEMRPRKLQTISVALSFVLHLSYLVSVELPRWKSGPERPEIEVRVTKLIPFVAERPPQKAALPEAEEPKLTEPMATAATVEILAEERLPRSVESPEESRADMTRAVLRYDDPRRELPAILRRYRGYIGFGRRNELDEYARRLFSAADGAEATPADGIVSLEQFCAIRIQDNQYPIVQELRRRYHLENEIAYALFSSVFADEVKHTLRKAAVDRFGGGKIASATLILTGAVENGLVVGDIVMAGTSQN